MWAFWENVLEKKERGTWGGTDDVDMTTIHSDFIYYDYSVMHNHNNQSYECIMKSEIWLILVHVNQKW